MGFSRMMADLLYAAIGHLHDDRYLQSVPQQDHGNLSGLADDDHSQYHNDTRGDARYLQSVPQQDHGGLSGLADDDHSQYHNDSRGDARYRFPIGFVYISVVSTSPATLLGYGTWAAFGAGRVLVGYDAGQTEFDAVEEIGGAKTHALTTAELAAHDHTYPARYNGTLATSHTGSAADEIGGTLHYTNVTDGAGSGNAHNNLQPYIVVYMWKRTA